MKINGIDTAWWEQVKLGQQDPWEKLKQLDVNKQMTQYKIKSGVQGQCLVD
jgi:hypothetical protein